MAKVVADLVDQGAVDRAAQAHSDAAGGSISRCAGCCRTRACAAARRPRWSGRTRRAGMTVRGRLRVGRSKTDAEARTVYLTPASVAALAAMRPAGADGAASLFGLSAPSISRRIHAAAAAAGLGSGFSGHSGRVGMARRMAAAGAPTHEIMAQGRWKTARMVEVYTRAEEAGRAAKWLA